MRKTRRINDSIRLFGAFHRLNRAGSASAKRGVDIAVVKESIGVFLRRLSVADDDGRQAVRVLHKAEKEITPP